MISACNAAGSTLLVIDLQQRLLPVIDGGATVVERATLLAHAARLLGIPVLGTAQSSAKLGPNLESVAQLLDRLVEKDSFDSCAAPDFLASIEPTREELVVVGCEAHVCVLQTVLGLLARNYKVKLVADAVGARRAPDKAAALARAARAGADIVTSEMVVFEWMANAHHPHFRQLLGLIK